MKKTTAHPPHALPLLCIECAGIALAVTLLTLTALSGVCLATENPTAYLTPCAYLSLLPGALCAGNLCARRIQKAKQPLGGIPCGLIAGGLYALLLFALGLVLPQQAAPTAVPDIRGTLIRTAAVLLVSAAAGYAVTHKAPKSRKPKRK